MSPSGANTTWAQIEKFARDAWPELYKLVVRFGSPQIRNVATLVGNVAHGSPIADALPFLLVMDAELEVVSAVRRRGLKINRFYKGYKVTELAADEIITRVHVPLPPADELLRLYKVSRRNDLDIATFGAAIRVRKVGEVDKQGLYRLFGRGGDGFTLARHGNLSAREAVCRGDLSRSGPPGTLRNSTDLRRTRHA